MTVPNKIRVGLYGNNGHQLNHLLKGNDYAEVTAIARYQAPAAIAPRITPALHYSLRELVEDPNVDLISLCSPIRADQVEDAIFCLQNGKHVYAEKPCALNEADLDRILAAANSAQKHFREMAQTALDSPYPQMREVVRSGVLGEIVQIFAQKSYPYHPMRPQDERIDGGLTLQVGVHAARWVEQVADCRIESLALLETSVGNPVRDGGLRMAATLQGRLEYGGLVTMILNYLNPQGSKSWGNDHLRIFGTRGLVESVDGGLRTSLVLDNTEPQTLPPLEPRPDHADAYFQLLLENKPMPASLEQELRPLRSLLRVKNFA